MLELKAEKREVGTGNVKRLRKEGLLPAVYYGPKTKTTAIAVDLVEFKRAWKEAGETTVVAVSAPEGKVEALIHEVTTHPVSGEVLHADFYVMEKGKPVEVSVPLEFTGESPAVKSLGGILVKVIHELDIEVLPTKIPHSIEVDISSLVDFESHIMVRDIKVPSDVKVLNDLEEIVASVSEQKEEEEATAPADLSAIEVEKKGKKEEGEE